MKKHLWIFFLGAPSLALILASIKVFYTLAVWKYDGKDMLFRINPGEAFSKINYRLNEANLIPSAKLFHRYCQAQGLMTKFKAGNYLIKSQSTMLETIDTLTKGVSITTPVTVPEGKNLYEIAVILEENKITSAKEFIHLAKDPAFAKKLGVDAETLEGYLYPDTYNFTEKSPANMVLETMVSEFNEKTKNLDFSKVSLSKSEVIILASIVEKETGAKQERPMIAGVFHNRLKKRMRLQSDPTTIYGIWEEFNGNLKKKHLLEKTAYNTYKIAGLPIGPISNPGIESIKAVLEPAQHEYLYFVSQNDGTHIFSKNYKDHQNAVEIHQKNSANRANKSWRDLKQ